MSAAAPGLPPGRIAVAVGSAVVVVLLAVQRPAGPITTAFFLTVLVAVGGAAVGWPRKAPDPRAQEHDRAQRQRWEQATAAHDDVLAAYGAFELDPAMLLRFPAMWDLSSPPIVNFHDALELAGSLRSDEYPGADHALEYVGAVSMLRTDWAAAERHARSTGTGGLSDADAGECRKAMSLWQHAEGATGPERATYLERVLGTLDGLADRGVVAMPEKLHDALAREVQKAIEA